MCCLHSFVPITLRKVEAGIKHIKMCNQNTHTPAWSQGASHRKASPLIWLRKSFLRAAPCSPICHTHMCTHTLTLLHFSLLSLVLPKSQREENTHSESSRFYDLGHFLKTKAGLSAWAAALITAGLRLSRERMFKITSRVGRHCLTEHTCTQNTCMKTLASFPAALIPLEAQLRNISVLWWSWGKQQVCARGCWRMRKRGGEDDEGGLVTVWKRLQRRASPARRCCRWCCPGNLPCCQKTEVWAPVLSWTPQSPPGRPLWDTQEAAERDRKSDGRTQLPPGSQIMPLPVYFFGEKQSRSHGDGWTAGCALGPGRLPLTSQTGAGLEPKS